MTSRLGVPGRRTSDRFPREATKGRDGRETRPRECCPHTGVVVYGWVICTSYQYSAVFLFAQPCPALLQSCMNTLHRGCLLENRDRWPIKQPSHASCVLRCGLPRRHWHIKGSVRRLGRDLQSYRIFKCTRIFQQASTPSDSLLCRHSGPRMSAISTRHSASHRDKKKRKASEPFQGSCLVAVFDLATKLVRPT